MNLLKATATPLLIALCFSQTFPASFIARCQLKGFFVPDGAFTDNAVLTVSLVTGTEGAITTKTGDVHLVINGGTSGSWVASGLLEGALSSNPSVAWARQAPIIVDKAFDIPFEAPLGASVFNLTLDADGRRVRQFFSNAFVSNQIPVGLAGELGLRLYGILPDASNPSLVASFIPTNTLISAFTTESTAQPKCDTLLIDATHCSVSIPQRGDASVTFDPPNSAFLSVFTYEDFTIFQRSTSRIMDNTSLGNPYRPNLIVEDTAQAVPAISIDRQPKTDGGVVYKLVWTSVSKMDLVIESSMDLNDWAPIGPQIVSESGRNAIVIDLPIDGSRYYRLRRPMR